MFSQKLKQNQNHSKSSMGATTHQSIFMMNESKNITSKIGARAQNNQYSMTQFPFQVNGLKGEYRNAKNKQS